MIRSASVENLGFDAVRFVYHLSLADIVGGGLAVGSAAAPAIFRTVRSRDEAGTIFGEALRRWDGVAVLCVVLIVVSSALAAGTEVTGVPETRLIVRWLALGTRRHSRRRCAVSSTRSTVARRARCRSRSSPASSRCSSREDAPPSDERAGSGRSPRCTPREAREQAPRAERRAARVARR